MKDKAKYGWYVGNLIVYFLIFGLIGLGLIIGGIFVRRPWNFILIITGIAICLVFLWPGMGMSALNIMITNKDSIVSKMTKLREIENPQVLDIGCGTGRTAIKIAKELTNGGYLTGIDIYSKLAISGNALETIQNNALIEGVHNRTKFQYGDATKIPFSDNSYDIVNMSSVLHEIDNDKDKIKTLNEIRRVMRQEGYLYISEWNRNSWQLILYMGLFSFVFKKRYYWEKLFVDNGFSIVNYEEVGGFGLFTIRNNRR